METVETMSPLVSKFLILMETAKSLKTLLVSTVSTVSSGKIDVDKESLIRESARGSQKRVLCLQPFVSRPGLYRYQASKSLWPSMRSIPLRS